MTPSSEDPLLDADSDEIPPEALATLNQGPIVRYQILPAHARGLANFDEPAVDELRISCDYSAVAGSASSAMACLRLSLIRP